MIFPSLPCLRFPFTLLSLCYHSACGWSPCFLRRQPQAVQSVNLGREAVEISESQTCSRHHDIFGMPSKYSHSVVLAQQSSRGLISLPNDQYISCLRSSPLLTTKPPPQRSSTAPPRKRQRATSNKTNGSERLAVRDSLRQQVSSDQLAAGARQHVTSNRRLHGTSRHHVIMDSEEEDSGEYSDVESQSSRPSQAAYSTTSKNTNLKQKRLPNRLPMELHQQVIEGGLLLPNSQNPQRLQKRMPQPTAIREPNVRESIELPIQIPTQRSALPARSRITASPVHNREFSNPKSLSTPQLSPTSTEMTHQEDSPDTPLSSLRRNATPSMADEQGPNLSRENSLVSQNTMIFRPGPAKMPSQANFDDFFDDSEQGVGYFKNPPESAEARKARLMNMRAYSAMEKAINDSPRKGVSGSEKNLPAMPNDDFTLHPPAQNRYRDRLDSLSSLSSASDFAIGVPSVIQKTSQPKTSAAAMRTNMVHTLEATKPRKASQSSGSSNPTPHASTIPIAKSPHQPLDFDPTLLDPTTTSLSQFLSGLESRFSEPDIHSDSGGATPPDIARHPPATLDPLAQLVVDARGGVTSLATREQQQATQRQRSKSGIFRSLRFRGTKKRGELSGNVM